MVRRTQRRRLRAAEPALYLRAAPAEFLSGAGLLTVNSCAKCRHQAVFLHGVGMRAGVTRVAPARSTLSRSSGGPAAPDSSRVMCPSGTQREGGSTLASVLPPIFFVR